MKIEMNVFGKNGRIMKTALASFLTLLVGDSCMYKRRRKKRGTKYQRRSDGSNK